MKKCLLMLMLAINCYWFKLLVIAAFVFFIHCLLFDFWVSWMLFDLGSLVHANDATGLNVNANDAVKCYLIYCLLFFLIHWLLFF
jgi:hypothetical protein